MDTKELRKLALQCPPEAAGALTSAADQIDALRAEVDRLRGFADATAAMGLPKKVRAALHHVAQTTREAFQEREQEMTAEIRRLASTARWIPVEERLPATTAEVLVKDGRTISLASRLHGYWLSRHPSLSGNGVTHWCPLPEQDGTPAQDGKDRVGP